MKNSGKIEQKKVRKNSAIGKKEEIKIKEFLRSGRSVQKEDCKFVPRAEKGERFNEG